MFSPRFLAAFALLAGLAALPIWWVDQVPLVDLPQHAAQVSMLRHWQDAACGYTTTHEINAFTPYWLAYGLACGLSWLVPVDTALRILLTCVLLAIPWLTARLVRDLGGDPWWALLCFPFGFGAPMAWGFVTFLVAVALVLPLLGVALRQARQPERRMGVGLGLACAALFAAHVLAMAMAWALIALLFALTTPRWRDLPRRAWPLLLSLPLPLAWSVATQRADPGQHAAFLGLVSLDRIVGLPVLLTGISQRWLAWIAVVATLAAVALARPRWSRERARWAPLAAVVAIVLLSPVMFLGTAYLDSRFSVLVLPFLLLTLDATSEPPSAAWRRWPIVLVAAALLLLVQVRFLALDREGAGLREVLRQAPPGERLLYLPYDRGSEHTGVEAFLHSGSWYAVDRCGSSELSFARNFPTPVRLQAERVTPLPPMLEYAPYRFRWLAHDGAGYGLVLVRSREEIPEQSLLRSTGHLELIAHRDRWWLYRNRSRRAGPLTAPPLPEKPAARPAK